MEPTKLKEFKRKANLIVNALTIEPDQEFYGMKRKKISFTEPSDTTLVSKLIKAYNESFHSSVNINECAVKLVDDRMSITFIHDEETQPNTITESTTTHPKQITQHRWNNWTFFIVVVFVCALLYHKFDMLKPYFKLN